MSAARLSIVVVTYNAQADVLACLASVHANPPDRPWDLVVVDNQSEDGTPDAVATRWPDVRLVRLPENIGFAAANNVGIRATDGPAGAAAQQRHAGHGGPTRGAVSWRSSASPTRPPRARA